MMKMMMMMMMMMVVMMTFLSIMFSVGKTGSYIYEEFVITQGMCL